MKKMKWLLIGVVSTLTFFVGLNTFINNSKIESKVETLIKDFSGLKMDIGNINIGYTGKISIDNIKIYDKNDVAVIDAPKAYIYINPLNPSRVKAIEVHNANVILERNKNNKFNIVELFSSSSKDKKTKSNVNRLGKVIVKDSNIKYIENTFEKPYEKDLEHVDGEIKFSSKNGITIDAKGEKDKEKLKVALKIPKGEDISLKMWFKDFVIIKEYSQYIPLEGLNILKGIVNGEFTLHKKFSGYFDVKNADVEYKDYEGVIENVNAISKIDNGKVENKITRVRDDSDLELNIDYVFDTENILLNIKGKDVSYEDINKYRPIKNLNIEATGLYSVDMKGIVDLKNDEMEFEGKASTNQGTIYGQNIEKVSSKFKYDKDSNLVLEDINLIYKNEFAENKFLVNTKLTGDFTYNVESKKGQGTYSAKNLGSNFDLNNITGNLYLNKSDLDVTFKNNQTNGNVSVDLKNKMATVNTKSSDFMTIKYANNTYKVKPDVSNLVIDYDNLKLVSGNISGNVENKEYFDSLYVSANIVDNGYDVNSVVNVSGEKFKVKGFVDNKINYNLNVSGNDIDVKKIMSDKNIDVSFLENADIPINLNANVKGNVNDIGGTFKITSTRGKYYAEYENLTLEGNIEDILNNRNLKAKAHFDELWIGYELIQDVSLDVKLNNNILSLYNLKNKNLSGDLTYNIDTNYMSTNFSLNHYVFYTTGVPEINVYVDKMSGEIKGTPDNLNGYLNLTPARTTMDYNDIGTFRTDIEIKNSVVLFKDINIRDSYITGLYNLNTKEMDMKFVLKEDDINQLKGFENLSLSTDTVLNIKGTPNKFDMYGDIKLNNVQYNNFHIPNISMVAEYKDINSETFFKEGVLDIKDFKIFNDEGEEIFATQTEIDLKDYKVDLKIEDTLDLSKASLLKGQNVSGNVDYSILANGPLDDIYVDFKVSGKDILVNNIKLDETRIDLQITNEELNISEFYVEYENNPLYIDGYALFSPAEYDISIIADNFNLEFLESYLKIEEASGIANINLNINNANTSGNIDLTNFSYVDEKSHLDIRDTNAKINIADRELLIDYLYGSLNGGTFSVNGDLDVPQLAEDFFTTKRLDLGKYDLGINMDNVDIYYGNSIYVKIDTDVSFTESKLFGKIDVLDGKIESLEDLSFLPSNKKSDVEIKQTNSTIKDSIVSEILDNIKNEYSIDLDLNIKDRILLDLKEYSYLKNISGDLKGNGKLLFNNNQIGLNGYYYVENGRFLLNNNKFKVRVAELDFGDDNRLLEINPSINLETSSTIDGEEVFVIASGKLSDIQMDFYSQSGLSKEEIFGLLAFNTTGTVDESDINGDNNTDIALLNGLLDTTINQVLLSRVTDPIKNLLGIDKIQFSTNLISQDENKATALNSANKGSSLWIQDEFNNGKMNWNAQVSLSESSANELASYDFWIDYEIINDLGISLGFEKYLEDNGREEDNNAHLGLQFSKRFDSTKEMLNSIFEKKEVEVVTNNKAPIIKNNSSSSKKEYEVISTKNNGELDLTNVNYNFNIEGIKYTDNFMEDAR